MEVVRSIKGESDEAKRMYSLVKKYDIMTSIWKDSYRIDLNRLYWEF